MDVDYNAVAEAIRKLILTEKSVSECMKEIIEICDRSFPHPDWSRLSAIDYDGDVAALTPWIRAVFERSPAPFPIQGLWVGLCNPVSGDMVWADMYVGSKSDFNPDDDEFTWLFRKEDHFPKHAEANSTALRTIYEIGYASDEGLGNNAEWPLCLAFCAFALRTILKHQTPALVGSSAARVGVAYGFDSGDVLLLGELRQTGFVIR